MKICFTSALFGDPKRLGRPSNFETNPNWDYFLFTDIDGLESDSWTVVNIKDRPAIRDIPSSIRKSRYPKFMSWELIEQAPREYDVVFYCDVYYAPNIQLDFESCAREILSEKNFPFMQASHPNRNVRRNGLNAEMDLIVDGFRDSEESMQKTKEFFKNYGPDVDLNFPQYFQNGVFGYDFHNTNVRSQMSEFWDLYTSCDISFRDQPLWNFLLLKNDNKPIVRDDLSRKTNKPPMFVQNKRNMSKHKWYSKYGAK